MKSLKNVLIVELYDHPKVLENIYHLLKNKCSVTFFMNKDKQISYDKLFPSAEHAQVIINKFHSSTMFIFLLFYGRKYDYINISTGPEGNHYSEIINILCFYICCLIYHKKIILTVKNIRPYLSSTPGVFSFFRSKGIKHLKKFTFETQTMKNTFAKYANIDSCLLSVSYDRYTDLLDKQLYSSIAGIDYNNKLEIKIGILGVIDESRRDYWSIISALRQLSAEKCSNITFVTLGACYEGKNNAVIKALSEYAQVDCIKGIISDNDFDTRGISCDLLISPLKPKNEYGTFKGSGSLGDAVYLRKKIILPSFVDIEKEFEEIAIYYDSLNDLLKIFNSLDKIVKTKPRQNFFEKFTTNQVYKQLVDDLKLC